MGRLRDVKQRAVVVAVKLSLGASPSARPCVYVCVRCRVHLFVVRTIVQEGFDAYLKNDRQQFLAKKSQSVEIDKANLGM